MNREKREGVGMRQRFSSDDYIMEWDFFKLDILLFLYVVKSKIMGFLCKCN